MKEIRMYIVDNHNIGFVNRLITNDNVTGKYRIDRKGDVQLELRFENDWMLKLLCNGKYEYRWYDESNIMFTEYEYFECKK